MASSIQIIDAGAEGSRTPSANTTRNGVGGSIIAKLDQLAKRAFDVAASLIGLLLCSAVFALVGLAIKLDSPGPILYRGPRAARGGGTFGILKFRTMYEDPASYDGPNITAKDDARITSLGRWLRASKINELPQLWNVLLGDMSLVGPRPEAPDIAAEWPESDRRIILSQRPGITSPATVLFHDEEEMLQSAQLMSTYLNLIQPLKLRFDRCYAEQRTFWSDIQVLLWTASLLLPFSPTGAADPITLVLGRWKTKEHEADREALTALRGAPAAHSTEPTRARGPA